MHMWYLKHSRFILPINFKLCMNKYFKVQTFHFSMKLWRKLQKYFILKKNMLNISKTLINSK